MIQKVILFLFLIIAGNASAHFMWVEANATGKVNQKQEVKVFFGEYTYGVQEKVGEEAFEKMKNFDVWVISPTGEKSMLQMKAGDTFYSSSFEPKSNGTYTVVLNNNKIDVIDYTQYDFGIFKTHYHSTAKVIVGGKVAEMPQTNADGLTVINVTPKANSLNYEATFKIMYKGRPLKESEVSVFLADQWSKKVTTDANGIIKFNLPWGAKYILEVTKKEEVPGKYNGKDYGFIWHCATYCIPAI